MNWTDLQDQWHRNEPAESSRVQAPSTISRLARRIRARDYLETAVGVLMLPFFVGGAVFLGSNGLWLASACCIWLAASIGYIIWRMRRERSKLPAPDPSRPLAEYLRAERAAMAAQQQLLASIWSWYLGPLGIGVVGLFAAIRGPSLITLGYTLFVVVLYAIIGIANKQAAKHVFARRVAELDTELQQLEETA